MAIRYDKKLNAEINRVVRNYNQKIRRIQKYEDSYNYILPETTSVKSLKHNVYTRNELKRKLAELKRFSNRGAENIKQMPGGFMLSRYEYENLKRERTRVMRNISREITRLETEKPTVYGKQQARTYAQMGDSYYSNLQDRYKKLSQKIEKIKRDDIEDYINFVSKIGRNLEYNNSLFRENYKKMVTDLAYYVGYDKERMTIDKNKLNELLKNKNYSKLVEKLDLKEKDGEISINKIKYLEYAIDNIKTGNKFYKLFNEEKSIKTIIEYYLPTTTRKRKKPINPEKIKEDVYTNYDNLIENIDNIIGAL